MTLMELGRAVLGGALIGAAATIYWRANGRVAGVSGILRSALLSRRERTVAIPFLIGLVAAGLVAAVAAGQPVQGAATVPLLAAAGLLVGIGTRISGGCTSGHGVCGLSRLSGRALAATLIFIATGALTVLVVSRVWPGLTAP